ncbi:AAA family ATPase [Solimonas variicoloris]|uniref:AAA family ATPase n=1 Tax=Solimonas variicoloris TaxID=254408 RepID=UPI0003634769|nr:AAA family ATPase [Solimonas variicoloris]
MALLDDILAWSNDLPDWQRDALRRIFAANGQLTEEDLVEIRAMVAGVADALKPELLTKAHIPTMGSGTSTILQGLSGLNNVNGFPNGRRLDIADNGITVIFGENGAGKSGYARVMKRACRARHSTPVLANAFTKGMPAQPEATFAYASGGKNHKTIWVEGNASNADLAMVSVYDSHCAQDYISKDGPSIFVPYGLHALSALATAQQVIQEQLNREIGAIHLRSDQFAALQGAHSVGKIMAKLGPNTDIAAFEALAKLTPQETEEIKELSAAIKGLDVEPEAIKHELLARRIDLLKNFATIAERFVSDAAMDKFAGFALAEDAAIDADRLAQGLLRGDGALDGHAGGLLPETGGEEWKALFKAAQAFSLKAYSEHEDHPASGPNDQCVLCQQSLGEDAQARMIRFRKFVAADAAQNLESARRAVTEARKKIDDANLAPVDAPTLAEIKQSDEGLAEAVSAHQAAWVARREWMAQSYMLSHWTDPRPPLPDGDSLSVRFSAKAASLRQRADQLRKAKDQKEHDNLASQLAELTSRRDLSAHLPALRTYISAAKRRSALEAARDALNTRSISTKITNLSRIHATDALAKAFNDELEALGYRHRVKPVLTSQTKGGRNVYGLALEGCGRGTHEVLSEGEQRAVALAFFLAEAKLRGDKSTIVFDDPSTSLDHLHRRKMAQHLVHLSSTRPVVIFTHDAVFLTTLLGEIAEQQAAAKIQTVEWQGGSPGALLDGLAWESKPYGDQMRELKATSALMKATQNPYPNNDDKKAMRDAYAHMRGMIERAIREVVLNDTVHPFSDEVRVIQVGAIAGFEIDEWRKIVSVYGKASEVIAGHDSPIAGQYEMPSPLHFENDLNELETVMKGCEVRRNAFNKKERQFMIDLRNKIRKS